MIRVILETPYAGGVEKNVEYARRCMLDCLQRGESPFASHLLYTQCLNDSVKHERSLGIKAGFEWRQSAEYTVVYTDLGMSEGMKKGIYHAESLNHAIKYRQIL